MSPERLWRYAPTEPHHYQYEGNASELRGYTSDPPLPEHRWPAADDPEHGIQQPADQSDSPYEANHDHRPLDDVPDPVADDEPDHRRRKR